MESAVSMDYAEIIYVIVGAALGFLASILTIIVQRALDRSGKLNIFYRLTNSRGFHGGWGFEKDCSGKVDFSVPVVYEIQNLSNTTRVVRDVSVLLYKDNNFVEKMIQLDHLEITHKKGKEITGKDDFYFGTDKGSYSFVIPPRSIARQECEYLSIIDKDKVLNGYFNNIRIRYYDEKNREKIYRIRDIEFQELKTYEIDKDWIILK